MEHITHIIVVHPSYHKFSESSVECIQDDLARGATISTAGSMLGGKVTFDLKSSGEVADKEVP